MESKKYTLEQEQIARFAKAMGHPARMTILEFLSKQDCCFLGIFTKNSLSRKRRFRNI